MESKCKDCIYYFRFTDNPELHRIECAVCIDRPNRSKDKSYFASKEKWTEKELEVFIPDKFKF